MSEEKKNLCSGCQGSGKCYKCDGNGYVVQNLPGPSAMSSGTLQHSSGAGGRRTCTKCYGSGTCPACKGTGKAS